jgi:DNA-3-methyladenine glycosylase II
MNYFQYGDEEISHLKKRDRTLGRAIDRIGRIDREVDTDVFSALVSSIVAQQISSKALQTVWGRIEAGLGEITPQSIISCPIDRLQKFGISFRKARYIRNAAEKTSSGQLDLAKLADMPDERVVAELTSLDGIGVWTAEMLMIFSLRRPDVLSFGDMAIHRGLGTLYRRRRIDRPLFEKYRARYSPYASTASLYLWAIASGE